MIGSLLDTILDRTVLAGYTRVGYRMRRGMWSTAEEQPMGGKVVLLTGGTSGLGLAAAESFARLGAAVQLAVRSEHPGWADTPGLESSLPRFYALTKRLLRTPQEGADTIVWLGTSARPARSSGGFWHDRRERPTHRVPWTKQPPQDYERLWSECELLACRKSAPLFKARATEQRETGRR